MTIETNSATNMPRNPSAMRRGLLALCFVAGGFIVGAGSFAVASADAMPGGFHHHHGMRIGFLQHAVRRALDNVGATTAQEDKIHDIIATTYTDLDKDAGDREAMRKQLLDLLKAPTIDRAAIEKLRSEKIAAIDAKSKTIVDALMNAAGQLTPDQRTKLAQNIEDRMARGGWGGWRHHDRMDGPGGADGDRPSDAHDHG